MICAFFNFVGEVQKKKDDLKLTEIPIDAPGSIAEGTEEDGVGVGVGEQPSQVMKEVEVWRESVGLTKKGKVYGLGLFDFEGILFW